MSKTYQIAIALLVAGSVALTATTLRAQGAAPEAVPNAPAEETVEPTARAIEPGEVAAVPAAGADEEEILILPEDGEDIPGAAVERMGDGDNRISITLDDVEMLDVVRMFTRISGANIIATPSNLLGRVTVNLTDVEWQPALESILDMHHLALQEKLPGSGVYSIVPREPGAPEPLIVETLFLRYASVSNLTPVVSGMIAQGGSVSAFPSRNAMIIRTTAANMGEVRAVVGAVDILREQVFIEAKFLELNDEAIEDLGINWQVLQGYQLSAGNLTWGLEANREWSDTRKDTYRQWDNRRNVDSVNDRFDIDGQPYQEETLEFIESPPDSGNFISRTTITPTRTITDEIDQGIDVEKNIEAAFAKTITDVRTAVLGASDFSLILSALKQMNGVQIVSNPKIVVANEEPAKIHIGETERPFISTVTPATQTTAPLVTFNPGDPVDFGVKLRVVPTVNTASNITVKIEPELTRFVRNAVAPDGQTYPIIATKRISTVFCLESGKTVAIGGLTETTENDVVNKIPLLGDLPLVGKYLFSHSHREEAKKETIIFVTVGIANPAMIEPNGGLPEDTRLTQKHMIKSAADRQAFQSELEELKQAADEDFKQRSENARSRLLEGN